MSDWQVGDLAVCVDARRNPDVPNDIILDAGRVYCVEGYRAEPLPNRLYGKASGLFLKGIKSRSITGAFAAQRFRKIRPDEHAPCEAEFVTLLKRTKIKEPAQ